ncbi:hypothetical protein BO83DRAFT_387443 [Aspergillus eucalypticola CBS 122712]|uniref:Uncharacterized protein n=1 Tax=Aspergillus eucalypticola (strain CBS 122712 / IBT 29274) TaxID=1448314 RepID=A0A317VQY5_ASPEC|nr:uncharacterized protein BO83DRAFT_387443 [Aspergillus eucalypticola CBS 122712]PWY76794.1 hypothetical protein BO83DRAFT_387443 [Aspergillus eucalypticola CBS 122712]
MSSSNTTTTKNPKSKSKSQSQTQEERPHLSANFANPSSQRIDYDHEVYLHLMSGDDGEDTRKDKNKSKTPNQVYREGVSDIRSIPVVEYRAKTYDSRAGSGSGGP